jgi:hypothetical protein
MKYLNIRSHRRKDGEGKGMRGREVRMSPTLGTFRLVISYDDE